MQGTYAGNFSWSDAAGNVIKPKAVSIPFNYAVAITGSLPVPDETPAGTEVDVPFVGLSQGASFVWMQNSTGQDLNMAWGGNWMPFLAAGGVLLWVAPQLASAGRITSLRFMLTQAQQGPGCIIYTVAGQ
jgi:hypothetical protein